MIAALVLAASAVLHWTSPPTPVARYRLYRSWSHGQTWESTRPPSTQASLWQDSLLTIQYVPGTPGTRQTAYIWTQDPYRGEMVAMIAPCTEDGDCWDPSNRVIVSTGLADTVMYLVRNLMSDGLQVIQDVKWPRNGGPKDSLGATLASRAKPLLVGWALAPGDSAMFRIQSQEELTREMIQYICRINGGRFPMWGRQNTCP